MQFPKLATTLALTLGLVGSSASALAQNKGGGIKDEIDALKAEVASLKEAATMTPTLAQAVQELSSKIVVLENDLAAKTRAAESVPETIESVDALRSDVNALQTELEYLRTAIANVEQPAVVPTGGGGAEYDRGIKLTTGDGRYAMTLGGFLQPRYSLATPEDFSSVDAAGFSLRRARLSAVGKLGGDRLRYATMIELTGSGAPLLDYYMDMRYRDELTVRVGQNKLPYTRSFWASSSLRAFHELTTTQEIQRYDRDIGVWVLGELLDGKLLYNAGVANGAGPNTSNPNIDVAASARLEGVIMGDYIPAGSGDLDDSEKLRLTVGGAVVHDLVRLPETVSGIEVDNRDVDGNGILDNVRVMSTALDAQLRYRGLDVFVEGTWRHERWGSILDHDDNGNLATAVDASSEGVRNYLGFTAEATYFVMPKKLLVGSRVSHGRLPLLGLGGLNPSDTPPAQRALQIDGLVQLYRDGYRRVGATYSMVNFNAKDGPEPNDDITHTFVLEAQLVL